MSTYRNFPELTQFVILHNDHIASCSYLIVKQRIIVKQLKSLVDKLKLIQLLLRIYLSAD